MPLAVTWICPADGFVGGRDAANRRGGLMSPEPRQVQIGCCWLNFGHIKAVPLFRIAQLISMPAALSQIAVTLP